MEPITFNRGILRPYMKGKISCDQNLIHVEEPTSLLWFIPTGHRSYQLPLAQVASVVSTSVNHWVGLFFCVFSLIYIAIAIVGSLASFQFVEFLAGLIVGALVLWLTLLCMPGYLVIATTAGQEARIKFTFFERSKAALAAQQLNQMIANRMDDTNVRINTDRVVEAINNK